MQPISKSTENLCEDPYFAQVANNRPVSCKVDKLQRQTSECITEGVMFRDFEARGDQSSASSEPVIPSAFLKWHTLSSLWERNAEET